MRSSSRRRTNNPRPSIERIIEESYGPFELPGVVDFLIKGPDLDISADEERFLVDAYADSELQWEVRRRVKELGRDDSWIETASERRKRAEQTP